jgi:chorismate mutase
MKTNDEEHPDINELRALWCEEKSKSMTFHAEVERLRADLATRTAERDALAAEVAALKAQADPQTDAQVQEQVASIVYAAMRFAREDVTPEWQAGNSHAEYRARQAATEIASMLRCALKAHDPLAEMWRELEAYHEQADRDGHGESWRRMCSERTEAAALAASRVATWVAARAAGYAARSFARDAACAVAEIRRAKEGTR